MNPSPFELLAVYHHHTMDSAQKQLQRVAPAMKRAHLEGVLIDDAAAALQGAKLAPMRLVFFVASMSPRALRRLALDLQAQASHSRHARHLRSLRLDVDFVSYAAGVKNFGTVQEPRLDRHRRESASPCRRSARRHEDQARHPARGPRTAPCHKGSLRRDRACEGCRASAAARSPKSRRGSCGSRSTSRRAGSRVTSSSCP